MNNCNERCTCTHKKEKTNACKSTPLTPEHKNLPLMPSVYVHWQWVRLGIQATLSPILLFLYEPSMKGKVNKCKKSYMLAVNFIVASVFRT